MPSFDHPDVQANIEALRDATESLQAAVDRCVHDGGHQAFSAPSRLPNWSIGHVVTHLARNADGLRRVLVGAKVGEQLKPYDSPQARADDIESGAQRSTETIAADFASATEQLSKTIDSLPQTVWSATVDMGRGGPTTADVVLSARLSEVELHHHDLGVDTGLDRLNDREATALLSALMRSYVRTRDVPAMTLQPNGGEIIQVRGGGQLVAGSAVDIASWLAGRTDGSALRTSGALPELPPW